MLIILDSHPVQYRAPVYRRLQELCPDKFLVVYATDCSVRGHQDSGFGRRVAWDVPLLEGYPHEVLRSEHGTPLSGFRSLHGKELASLFRRTKPRAVYFTQFLYEYDFVGLWQAKCHNAKVWIRQETQDYAFERGPLKALMRGYAYQSLYRFVDLAFYIGELNRRHLLKYGFTEDRLVRSPYVTPDTLAGTSNDEKALRRRCLRDTLGVGGEELMFSFFGKLIPKKNPDLLLHAAISAADAVCKRLRLLFVGSGELEATLRQQAKALGLDRKCIFTGFVNQSQLPDYYLASDIVALPSRRMGETWGLVVNEALQAGCRVIVSNAVGCHAEFSHLEGFRVIPEGDVESMVESLNDLAALTHNFDWAVETMDRYTIDSATKPIADQLFMLD